MKNKFIVATFFSIFLLASPSVKAVNFTDYKTVEANKTWTVKFTSDVGFDDATKQGITVTDSKGNTINVYIQLGEDRKTITVTAPEGGYIVGESYILNVGTKAHSNKGKALKNEYKVHFTIKSNYAVVTFNDKNLEQVVRDAIKKPTGDIYKSDVEKITTLDASYREVQNLNGIENLINLQQLNLSNNEISDISPLKGLINLQQLDLGYTVTVGSRSTKKHYISDISALERLTNLQSLSLSCNQIKDISVLKGLTNLQQLNLSLNRISDISALEGLTNLQQLKLADTLLTDVSALKGLTKLEQLDLSSNNINEISKLNGLNMLTNLKQLGLSSNGLSHISKLSVLSNLQELDLSWNYLDDINASDISTLKELTNLQYIDLACNGMNDNVRQLLKQSLSECHINYDINFNKVID